MSTIAANRFAFEIDVELDSLLDEIEEQTAQGGEPAGELVARFQQFCSAHSEKVDRIGRFVRIMEAREQYCRSESARLTDRARAAAGKVERSKNMVLYYCLAGTSRRSRAISSRCARRRTARIPCELPTKPQCRSHTAEFMHGLTELSGRQSFRFLPDELAKALESSVQEIRLTQMRSKWPRCVMNMSQGRKFAAVHI